MYRFEKDGANYIEIAIVILNNIEQFEEIILFYQSEPDFKL